MREYVVIVVGVDGSDCMYQIKAKTPAQARQTAVSYWTKETLEPVGSITVEQ